MRQESSSKPFTNFETRRAGALVSGAARNQSSRVVAPCASGLTLRALRGLAPPPCPAVVVGGSCWHPAPSMLGSLRIGVRVICRHHMMVKRWALRKDFFRQSLCVSAAAGGWHRGGGGCA